MPVAPPKTAQTPGATPPPMRLDQPQSQASLEQIGTKRTTQRDPKLPYETVSALISAGPTTNGERDPKAPFEISGAGPKYEDELPPPSGEPTVPARAANQWAPPGEPARQSNQWAPPYQQQPGMPGQWAPPPAARPPVNRNLILISYAALLIGALWSVTAPWMLLAAGGLLSQTKAATKSSWLWALSIGIILVVLALIGIDTDRFGLLSCLGMIAAVSILDYSAHKRR